jgi:hypothetical protein
LADSELKWGWWLEWHLWRKTQRDSVVELAKQFRPNSVVELVCYLVQGTSKWGLAQSVLSHLKRLTVEKPRE